jgi:hypothetical protein
MTDILVSQREVNVLQDLVQGTRDLVLESITGIEDLCDPKDIDRLKSDDHFIRRYVQDQIEDRGHSDSLVTLKPRDTKTIQSSASEKIVATLKWRKEHNVGNISGDNIPREFFTKQFIVIDEANKMLIFRGKLYFTVNEWMDVYQGITRFILESFEQRVKRGTIVLDLRDVTLSNVDHNILYFLINTTVSHYPQLFSSLWYYETPWILKPVVSLISLALPDRLASKIVRLNEKEAVTLLGGRKEQLPDFMGGKRQLTPDIPSCSLSVQDLGKKLNKSKASTDRLSKILS